MLPLLLIFYNCLCFTTTHEICHNQTLTTSFKQTISYCNVGHDYTILNQFIPILYNNIILQVFSSPTTVVRFLIQNCHSYLMQSKFLRGCKIETLEIVYNKIKKLYNGSFKNIKIERLRLTDNSIESIENGTFTNIINLQWVSLSGNNLCSIDDGWFLNTTFNALSMNHNHLRELNLNIISFLDYSGGMYLEFSHNEINNLGRQAIKKGKYTSLELGNNLIDNLPEDFCDDDRSFLTLNLENNRLRSIPEACFRRVRGSIYLQGNPLDTQMLDFIDSLAGGPTHVYYNLGGSLKRSCHLGLLFGLGLLEYLTIRCLSE